MQSEASSSCHCRHCHHHEKAQANLGCCHEKPWEWAYAGITSHCKRAHSRANMGHSGHHETCHEWVSWLHTRACHWPWGTWLLGFLSRACLGALRGSLEVWRILNWKGLLRPMMRATLQATLATRKRSLAAQNPNQYQQHHKCQSTIYLRVAPVTTTCHQNCQLPLS